MILISDESINNYLENEVIRITFNAYMLEEYDQQHKIIHPKRKKRVLDFLGKKRLGLLPSWNIFLNVSSRIIQNERKKSISDYTNFILKKFDVDRNFLDRCAVIVKQYNQTKVAFDLDNIHTKSSFDSFTEYHVWEDDNVYILEPLIFTGGHDKDNPRTEILIFPITEEFNREFVLNCMVKELVKI